MAISAVLLCFVGVWAAQVLNLKFTGVINPDIICKIEVKEASAENYTILFDNHENGKAEDFLDNQNRLKNFSTTLDGTVANTLDFKLTNYTPNKHIRLSIQNILIDGETFTLENLSANHTSANAEKMGAQPNTGTFSLSLSANKNGSFTINLSLLVEEVYAVSTSGTGLANPGKFFFAEDEEPKIPLMASVSYQLPQSPVFNKLIDGATLSFTDNTTFVRANNTEALATFAISDLKDNVSILCNCDRVFFVEKNLNPSLFENAEDTMQGTLAPFDNTKTYIPNNGKYTYSADYSQVTKADGYKEYPYYITLGEYPQTKVDADLEYTLTMHQEAGELTHIKTYSQNIRKKTDSISWYEYQNEKYALSTYIPYGASTPTTAWFKVEPITWVVLDAQKDGQPVSLDTLTYDSKTKMLYVDKLCGKPFSGSLVLMSAYALDASEFQTSNTSYANFLGSQVHSLLTNSISASETLDGTSTLSKMLETAQGENYINLNTLKTYSQTDFEEFEEVNNAYSLFLLAGANTNETHHASLYFSGAPEKDTNIVSSSLAVTSPTDFALAHYIETSASTSTSSEPDAYNNPNNLASPRGWAVGTAPTTSSVCTYWTRSAHYSASTMAKVVNTRGTIRATNITDPHIGIRPCMVLDIGFYYSGIFNYN